MAVTETYNEVANGGSDSVGWTCKQPVRALGGTPASTGNPRPYVAADTTGNAVDVGTGSALSV